MKSNELIQLSQQYGARNYLPLPIVISEGSGCWVSDPEGKKYLDCLSSYSALNHGHCHPALLETLTQQARKCTLTSRAFHNDQLGPFLKQITQLCSMDAALPMNTGAEAVETAIKALRKWGYTKKGVEENRAEIIVCENNFHGRTTTIVSFSSEEAYRSGFGPFTPGFRIIPYGDLEAFKSACNENTVGFLVEPIQGEAGVVIPPVDFLKGAFDFCEQNNILFVADEIQTGLGRTGRMFCCEHFGFQPHAYVLGKALGGGVYPISVLVGSRDLLGVFEPGEHGSTFGGNPLACAIALKALEILESENLVTRAWELGSKFQDRLFGLNSKYVAQVRGKGLLIGIVLKESAGGARQFCERLMQLGVLCKETHEHVIRVAPPLIVNQQELDFAFEKIQEVLQS
jgi:ornithine--oxo-acid transaminase